MYLLLFAKTMHTHRPLTPYIPAFVHNIVCPLCIVDVQQMQLAIGCTAFPS